MTATRLPARCICRLPADLFRFPVQGAATPGECFANARSRCGKGLSREKFEFYRVPEIPWKSWALVLTAHPFCCSFTQCSKVTRPARRTLSPYCATQTLKVCNHATRRKSLLSTYNGHVTCLYPAIPCRLVMLFGYVVYQSFRSVNQHTSSNTLLFQGVFPMNQLVTASNTIHRRRRQR